MDELNPKEEQIKVLFLCSWYPTIQKPTFGLFTKKHAQAVSSVGNSVTVLSLQYFASKKIFSKITTTALEDGIETHLIHIHSRIHKWLYVIPFLNNWIIWNYFKNHLQEKNFSIIHANSLYPAAIAANYISKKTKIKYLITEHWSKVDKYMRTNLLAFYGKNAYNQASCITCVSHFLGEGLKPYIQAPEKIRIVPNVVDISVFNFKDKKSAQNKKVFTAVATWKSPKIPSLFFDALNAYQRKTGLEIILNMVGNGPLLDDIQKKQSNIQVKSWGILGSNEIARILHDTDYFVHASSIETFSIVVAEALATGTPVICSNTGALPELIHLQNGVLVKNNLSDWIDGIEKLTQTAFDNEEISQETKYKFDNKVIGDLFTNTYFDILSQTDQK